MSVHLRVIFILVTLTIIMTFAVVGPRYDHFRPGQHDHIVVEEGVARWIGLDRSEDWSTPEVEIVERGEDHLRLRVRSHGFSSKIRKEEQGFFEEIAIPGAGVTTEIGKAEMPVIRRWIEVPHGVRLELQVEDSRIVEFDMGDMGLYYPVYPAQEPVPKSTARTVIFSQDKAHYTSEPFYPADLAQLSDVVMLRGRRLALLEVSPAAFSPKTARVRWAGRIDIRLEWSGADPLETSRTIVKHRSESFDQVHAGEILNFGAYDGSEPFSARAEARGESSPAAHDGILVITPNRFADELETFVEWKRRKGHYVEVAETGAIGSTPTAIKTHIQSAYDSWTAPPLAYVILVGDIDEIPPYLIDIAHVADSWYGRLSGGDFIPDVWVGRLSVVSELEVDRVVRRIVEYERAEFLSSDWLKRATFIATDDVSHYQVAEGSHDYCISSYMNPERYASDRLYAISTHANTSDVRSAINSGRAIVTYSGHGSRTAWLGPDFTQSHINTLNHGDMTPFVISHACLTASIEEPECYGETWLRKSALGFWGASDNTYWGEDDILEKAMYRALYEDGYHTLGQMTADALLGLFDQYGGAGRTEYYYEVYHLLGDPSMMLWLEEPERLTVEHTPLAPLGAPTFQVRVSGAGAPVSGALVSLYGADQDFQSVAFTDASGEAVLSMAASLSGDGMLNLTVTRQGYFPHEGVVELFDPDGPFMVASDFSIIEPSGDGAVNPGETVTLVVHALNVGTEAGEEVTAILSTESALVQILDGTATFGSIAPGEIGSSLTPHFRWRPYSHVPDGTVVPFILSWNEDGGAWGEMEVTVAVCANDDGDEWATCHGDCDDTDSRIHPGAPEVCDGVDNNCDGERDEGHPDTDRDGAADCIDCADQDPFSYPGAVEVCDGSDNDCDGAVGLDEDDSDGDGFRGCHGDCDDSNPLVNPGREEIPGNRLDDNCNGQVDELCFIGVAIQN